MGLSTVSVGDAEGLEHFADVIMPRGHAGAGDGPETVPDFRATRSCKLNDRQPCHTRYSPNELANVQLQYLSMTHDDLDTAVLAKLSSGMHVTSMTNESRKKEQKEQNMQRTDFYHHSFRICHDLFTLLHGISQDKLIALVMHYKVAGVEARVQRNKCKPTACV